MMTLEVFHVLKFQFIMSLLIRSQQLDRSPFG